LAELGGEQISIEDHSEIQREPMIELSALLECRHSLAELPPSATESSQLYYPFTMENVKSKTGGKKKGRVRWISWLFGLAILVAVALFAAHRSEGQEFARLVAHTQPIWLLLGLMFQMGTYIAEARIWQLIIVRAGISMPLWSYISLSFAKLFMDQMVPSGGVSGTLLIARALDRRGIPRRTSMAAIVVDLVSYYAAYVATLAIALGIVWVHGGLTLFIMLPAAIFAPVATGVPVVLVLVSRGRRLPQWIQRLPIVGSGLRALAEAAPGLAHDGSLIAWCISLQVAIFLLDAGTLWIMLCALGLSVYPAQVFASFMLSTLARTLGPLPGGLGIFEAASVATLKVIGVPIAAGLAATLLFRGFSYWLPLVPGILLARREARA
jgi:uncharacterized protein (TIRG00374 family)